MHCTSTTTIPPASMQTCYKKSSSGTRLFKFIPHPHECAVDSTDRSYIPAVRDFELQAADLKASDMWVNKFKSLNEDLERLTGQQAELASQHKWAEMKKTSTRRPADCQNLERASRHIPHTAACEYCCTDNVWLYVCM